MSAQHPAIRLNNLAIFRMEQQDFASASFMMGESIANLKQDGSDRGLLPARVVSSAAPRPERTLEAAEAPASHSGSLTTVNVPIATPAPSASVANLKEHLNHRRDLTLEDSISVFRRPLRIHPDALVGEDTYIQICAIVMYNCALAHHLNALQNERDQDRRRAMLKDALNLYKVAHSIHLRNASASDMSLTLAILNNVGQLHAMLNNRAGCRRCFDRMLRILMVLVVHSEDCMAGTDDFFLNISRFIFEKPSAPAA